MDRRRHNDFWAKLLFSLNIVAIGMIVVILLILHRAQPEYETLFDRFYQLQLRTQWDLRYLAYLVYLVIFGMITSVFGIVLSRYRGRRKQDHKNILIVSGIIFTAILWLCLKMI